MDMNNDTAAIKALRSFALQNGELAFAHLCTAALPGRLYFGHVMRPVGYPRFVGVTMMQDAVSMVDGMTRVIPVSDLDGCDVVDGEEWAIERVTEALRRIAEIDWAHRRDMTSPYPGIQDNEKIAIIHSTDTARPDGANARGGIDGI